MRIADHVYSILPNMVVLIKHPILLPELPDKTFLYRTVDNFGGRKYWQIEILVKLILANCHD